MKFALIEANSSVLSVKKMCRLLDVSRSGYYAWLARPPSAREVRRERLAEVIVEIHVANRGRYGSPRIAAELRERDYRVGENTVAAIMREKGISAENKRKFRVATTNSKHDLPIAPNLLGRDFRAARPNEAWLSDITYIPTAEGWAYLCAIKDLCSREIVGWALADHMRTELVLEALRMAVGNRRPGPGLIFHSDRGVQYASAAFRAELARHGFAQSMSGKGNCYDNAPMESFFGSLKTEEVHRRRYATLAEAKRNLFDYIEVFYNRRRRHSSLNYLSPVEYLKQFVV